MSSEKAYLKGFVFSHPDVNKLKLVVCAIQKLESPTDTTTEDDFEIDPTNQEYIALKADLMLMMNPNNMRVLWPTACLSIEDDGYGAIGWNWKQHNPSDIELNDLKDILTQHGYTDIERIEDDIFVYDDT